MKVLDASVVLKWFLKEKNSDKAIEIKTKIIKGKLMAVLPGLILYEIANALRYKKGYTSELVSEAIDAILGLDIDVIIPTPDLVREAVEIGYQKDVSIYDAIYVALAKDIGYRFITADKKLYEKVKDFQFVELL